MVAARLARQQILDTDRTFHLVLTESALRWHVGSPEIMARQAEHLVTVTERPNVRLGIISWTRPVTHPVLHVGERDVQAVQHAGALAKCVGAPQVLAPQSVEAWIHAAYRQFLGMKPHAVMRPPDWELALDEAW
jgi:hypothetical protein